MKQFKTTISQMRKNGAAALILFLAVAGILLFSAFFSAALDDETFYYATARRIAEGDRLFVDEWHPSQCFALFMALPYRAITALAGGTDGIVLAMRLVFIAAELMLYWFLLFRLTSLGGKCSAWMIIASALFCCDLYAGFLAFNYYNIGLHGVAVAVLLLWDRQRAPALRLALAGIVFSCAVLNQPGLALIYILYTLAAAVAGIHGKKRNAGEAGPPFLSVRTWLCFTAGIVLSAAGFLTLLLSTGGLENLIRNLPGVASDSEHLLSVFYLIGLKAKHLFAVYSPAPVAAMALLLIGAAVSGRLKKNKRAAKITVLALSLAVSAFWYAAEWRYNTAADVPSEQLLYALVSSGVPVLFLGFTAYFLFEKKNKTVLLALLLALGCSVCVDLTSNATIAYGGRLAYFPAVYGIFAAVGELRGPRPAKLRLQKYLARALAAAFLIVERVGVTTAANRCVYQRNALPTVAVEDGPLKGLYASELYNRNYHLVLADLDTISADGDSPFYTAELLPFTYLCLDLPTAACSAFYVEEESEERQTLYWELHPEKTPEYLYIPKVSYDLIPHGDDEENRDRLEKKLAFAKSLGECEITNGRIGYIVRIYGRRQSGIGNR